MKAYERLLKYVQVETTSDPKSGLHPSTPTQIEFAKMLIEEMKTLGIKDIIFTKEGYVYGLIPKNIDKKVPTIGLIAHMDTSSDMTAKNVNPQIHKNYNGEDIVLNKEKNIVMKVSDFPFLKELTGRTLITTDGLTLLGADDKAGIAEILTLAEILKNNPDIKHGDIKIAFTPDEEIGEGAMFFDVEGFGCDFAYTVDGDKEGYLNFETFNAASVDVTINGRNIHPGSAKQKMINSIHIAYEFHQMLPTFFNPAFTEQYEGFNHLNEINGTVEKTQMHYIVRNHDFTIFEKQKEDFKRIAEFLNQKYPDHTVELTIKDSYYNMYEHLKNHPEIIELAKDACKMAQVEPVIKPVRGGTDGAVLTYKGLMCPNIGTGGFNFHGKYEFITVEGMDKTVEILQNIVTLVASK